jgi:hypothetical protein
MITAYNLRPTLEKVLFLLRLIPWAAAGVFGLVSICGFVSPESLTPGLRIFLTVWVMIWIGGGGILQWKSYLRAFIRVEIFANKNGVGMERKFPFESKKTSYPWEKIEDISYYFDTGSPSGGVAVQIGGKLITLESDLPEDTAEEVYEALLSVAPNLEEKAERG